MDDAASIALVVWLNNIHICTQYSTYTTTVNSSLKSITVIGAVIFITTTRSNNEHTVKIHEVNFRVLKWLSG